MSDLRIAPGLTLPIDVAGEATAILAKRGAGKSNTAKVVVEEILDSGLVQVIALDPVGHWWSLRAGANGKPRGGYEVAVFGGMHGDLPLEATAGKLLAQTAVESGQSIVLDVSGLDSNGAMQRFAYEFAEELYKLKQATPTPLLLVLEEADEFAPQTTSGPNVARMVGAFARLMKRGRGRGIGMLVISQRSAALSKNVLDQADTLIVMRTVGPRDRAAIEGWIKHQSADGADKVLPSLPSLATGEAWIWNPERDVLRRVQIRKARTFDSTQSSRPGEKAVTAEVKPIDVEQLGQAIAATVERVKENDPGELRRRIVQLERKLAERSTEQTVERVEVQVPVEVPVIDEALVARLEAEVAELLALAEVVAPLRAVADQIQESLRAVRAVEPPAAIARPSVAPPRPAPAPAPRREPVAAPDGRVSRPQQKILDALAWFEAIGVDAPRRPPLAAVAGVSSKSSGFRANVSTLSGLGLVSYPGEGRIALTDDGRQVANPPQEMPTEHDLHEAIYRMISRPQTVLLEQLVAVHPEPLTREELATRAGVSPLSSGFRANVSTLSGFELIVYPSQGSVAASDLLFPQRTRA